MLVSGAPLSLQTRVDGEIEKAPAPAGAEAEATQS